MNNNTLLPICWCVVLLYLALISSASEDAAMMSKSLLTTEKNNSNYKAFITDASNGRIHRFEVPRMYDGNNETEVWYWDEDSDFPPGWLDPTVVSKEPTDKEAEKAFGPRLNIYPEEYVDNGRLYIEFACEAPLKAGDVMMFCKNGVGGMSSYTEKEDRAENKTVIFKQPTTLWIINNTQVFCYVAHADGQNNTYSKVIRISYLHTKYFSIKYVELFILPTPTAEGIIYYDDKNALELNCWGRKSRDKIKITNTTEFLTMYQIQGSRNKRLASMVYDLATYQRTEYSTIWKISDNGTKIICAKEFKWVDGRMHIKEQSAQFTLIYRSECEPRTIGLISGAWAGITEDCAWDSWVWAVVAMVVAFIAEATTVAMAAMFCFCPK